MGAGVGVNMRVCASYEVMTMCRGQRGREQALLNLRLAPPSETLNRLSEKKLFCLNRIIDVEWRDLGTFIQQRLFLRRNVWTLEI